MSHTLKSSDGPVLAELVLSHLLCKSYVAGLATHLEMGEYLATIVLFSAKDQAEHPRQQEEINLIS